MEFIEIINKVMVKLREGRVTNPVQSQFSQLVSSLVNDAKREVEDAWQWTSLRQTISFETVNGQDTYALEGLGPRGEVINIWNKEGEYFLRPVSHIRMRSVQGNNSGEPAHYMYSGVDSYLNPVIRVWPVPTDTQTIEVYCKVPQKELIEGNDKLLVPWWPVYLGAYSLAVEERGEEGGVSATSAALKYQQALADAIALDALKVTGETTWEVE